MYHDITDLGVAHDAIAVVAGSVRGGTPQTGSEVPTGASMSVVAPRSFQPDCPGFGCHKRARTRHEHYIVSSRPLRILGAGARGLGIGPPTAGVGHWADWATATK